ncbi:MAG: glycosyltransferase family 2 protein [Candidatus Daviesbacteria bacterium]|nr:glycosyltransferase family 2 protein [Candidatus Daviesbacteria bacterium]
MSKISVIINTLNEDNNIEGSIKSVSWTDEIIVCDMYSQDKTVEIAKKAGAKVIFHKRETYVEPARNFAVLKASGDWILVIDADEQIPATLAERLQQIAANMKQIDYVRIPRKNLIFGHFLRHSGWWPDYNIRFFKKDTVSWTNEIHRPPKAVGTGLDLEAEEKYAIIHHSYESISQFLERMNRYTTVEANELNKQGKKFIWKDLFVNPLNEFLSRFFALEGYKDGLHGLVLSLLQAFSFLVVSLKLWEIEKFRKQEITLEEVQSQNNESVRAINYWFKQSKSGGNFLSKLFKRR